MASKRGPRRKKFAKNTNEMSKEVLVETLKKKKECNAKALAIVERLCEPCSFDEEWLLSNLEFINQSHFDDVIVERSILKLCGYPLCNGKLENVPSKKYHISARLNKVYDITERKNFCSSICYKAGIYLRSQLLTSPLWVRNQEIIPKFHLLTKTSTSLIGEEIVFLAEKEKIKQEVLSEKKEIINTPTEEVCVSIDKIVLSSEDAPSNNFDKGDTEKEVESDVQQENGCIKSDENVQECDNVKVKSLIQCITFDSDANSKNIEEKNEEIKRKDKYTATDLVNKVEKSIYEWFSFDTILYLYGEDKIKDIFKQKKDEIKVIIGKKPLARGYNERIDRMLHLYSLLDQEIFDSKSVNENLRPLPDYSAIKEDGKKLEIKVKAFYSGQLEINECNVVEEKYKEDDKENEIYLPTVDAHAQNTLRIKIVLDRFHKIIPELLRTFTSACCFQPGELRNLVNHFTLSSHNITFKPGEWHLMGLILIKLLSLKNKQLEGMLNSETGRMNVALFLMNYGLPSNYLEKIVEWLADEEILIRKLK